MEGGVLERVRTVGESNGLAVRAVHPAVDLDQHVWAINLLTRRPKWSYETYNVLAYRRVIKVNGRIFFKGSRVKQLDGASERDRELLLIVFYPGAMSFLRMVTHPIYRLVSWFRVWGTPDLALDFATRCDAYGTLPRFPRRWRGDQHYLLHHFCSEPGTIAHCLPEIQALAEHNRLKISFAGEIVAHIEAVGQGLRTLPPPVRIDYNALLLFEGADPQSLERFYWNSDYAGWRRLCRQEVATVYNRIH